MARDARERALGPRAGRGGGEAGDLQPVDRKARPRSISRSIICRRHAPKPQAGNRAAAGAPFGAITVNKETCTLCKACIGACPEAALLDSPEAPLLRFIERNCVQCGLCANTCPEDAIRSGAAAAARRAGEEPVTLNEAEPFNCVRCGKPFGTRRMVDSMIGKLGAHSMFAGGGALKRLQMCADCRVIDMMGNKDEPSIFDYRSERADRSACRRWRPRTRRAPASTACSRGCSTRRRTQDVLAQVLHVGRLRRQRRRRGGRLARTGRVPAATRFPCVLENEHTALFVGTGKAEVTPYLTHYLIKYATDNPLVELRQQLNRWGMRAQGERQRTRGSHRRPLRGHALCYRGATTDCSKSRRCSSSAICTAAASRFAMR